MLYFCFIISPPPLKKNLVVCFAPPKRRAICLVPPPQKKKITLQPQPLPQHMLYDLSLSSYVTPGALALIVIPALYMYLPFV